MTDFDDIARRGLKMLDASRHGLFAKAFRDSLQLDTKYIALKKEKRLGKMPNVPRASDLASVYNFDLRELRRLHLCITRPTAFELLDGSKLLSESAFLQEYTSDYYSTQFGKPPIFFDKGERQMLLTIAEWFHLAGVDTQRPFPEVLRKMV